MAEPESPFLRPSPWGKMPQQAPMRIGPLPKADAPLPRPSAPGLVGEARPASRSNILGGSLIPTAAKAPATPPAPEPAPPTPPAPEPVFDALSRDMTPPPIDEVTLAEVVVTPAEYLRKRQPKRSSAPWVIGGTVALVAVVGGLLILTGKDAGQAPAATQTASQPAPAPPVSQPIAPALTEQAVAPPAAPSPATPVITPAESRPQVAQVRPQRSAQAPAAKVAPKPAEAAQPPIALNPTPIETPPPTAPVVLKPYTAPTTPDPDAPMTNQQPGR